MTPRASDPGLSWAAVRRFFGGDAAGGLVLMASAALAMAVANSPLAGGYFAVLHAEAGGLSVLHWINDGLMALFFLLVGMELKREMLERALATWPRRILPGIAALGGMAAPAVVYLAVQGAFRPGPAAGPSPPPPISLSRWACCPCSAAGSRRR